MSGVSIATVSRALSRPGKVNDETLTRIKVAARRLGYIPGGTARALASGRTMLVGGVFPTIDHAIFARAIQGLQARLTAAGYQLLVAAHDYSPAAEAAAVRAMLAQGVDALTIVGADHLDATWDLLTAASIPVLMTWSFDPRLPSIGFDNERAGRLAAQHLVALGHSRIGVISGAVHSNDRARLRLAGIRRVLGEAGCALSETRVVEQPFTLSGGRAGLAHLLSAAARPTAVICGNDLLAAGAVFEAQSRGIAIPSDLSVMGIDNLEIASQINPPLTTVHLPTAELGQRAADLLLGAAAAGERLPRSIELPIELVVRASTARPHGIGAVRSRRKALSSGV